MTAFKIIWALIISVFDGGEEMNVYRVCWGEIRKKY